MSRSGDNPDAASLLSFFHVCPEGLIAFDDDGSILLANPEAVNLLLPAFKVSSLGNVFEAFGQVWPELRELVGDRIEPGRISTQHRISVGDEDHHQHLAVTVVRVETNYVMAVVSDVTRDVDAENERIHLLQMERSARERTELLERSATHLAAAATIDELAQAVLADLAKALSANIATVNVIDGDGIRIIASDATLEEADSLGPGMVARYINADLDVRLPGPEAIRTNNIIRIETAADIERQFPAVSQTLHKYPLSSLFASPLRSANGKVLGSLVVGSAEPYWLDAPTMSLLGGLVDQVGLTLERAKLFEEVLEAREQERAVAIRLQMALLPERLVEHPMLDIAASYRAADARLAVGGDWYDTFEWPDGRIGIMVGDVAGHDINSTAAMGRLRASVAALAPVTESSPAALILALAACAAGSVSTSFVTAACLVIDPATGSLTYSTAGHPPPLLIEPGCEPRWLNQANSPPVGFPSVATRPEATIEIAPGSTVILYSDGLIERRGEILDIGLARLAAAAQDQIALDVHSLPSALIDVMVDVDEAGDDIVAVVVRLATRAAKPLHS